MTILVDWVTQVITVPKADLTPVSGNLFDHDTEVFRQQVKDAETSEEGITHPDIIKRNEPYTISGVTYAQALELVNGFKILYEIVGVAHTVRLKNSNNNFHDVEAGIFIENGVIPVSGNSAGLQVVTTGSGVLPGDINEIVAKTSEATRQAIFNEEGF